MISMAYARDAKPIVSPCGNDSFLRRNDLNDLRAAVRNRSFLTGRILSLSCSCAWSERVAQRRRFPLALLHRVPDHGRLANGGQKKLRESAATSLKRLSRVNLRASPSDLSAGAELAAATHQPKAVIEFNSAPSSQAFVVAESGQTTVEFWRRVFKDHAFPRGTEAHAANRPECRRGSSSPGITY
jgi:hypothetical protein